MKKQIASKTRFVIILTLSLVILSCKETVRKEKTSLPTKTKNNLSIKKKPLSKDFKKYWYGGEAEITSYKLEQARYGEIREGNAVLIYVTEPFLNKKQVKADNKNPDNIPVLKLNSTKNYITGIYPYSIMSSSFYPVYDNQHALKISFSSQEWCGQVYAQLNNRNAFEVTTHSYFESEADTTMALEKNILENELWNKIRINPNTLPTGDLYVIPSMEYIRLSHNKLKPYEAIVSLSKKKERSYYKVEYPELNRTLEIVFNTEFPHSIESWTDSFKSGFGANAKIMTSKATKLVTIKSAYWSKNSNRFLPLRDSLQLN